VVVATADAAPVLAREFAAVVPAVARRHAFALTPLAVADGAGVVSVASADLGAIHLDALLVGTLVGRCARRLALPGGVVADLAEIAVVVAAADAPLVATLGSSLAGRTAAVLLAVAVWLALVLAAVAVAVGAVLISETATNADAVDRDALLVGAVVGGHAWRLALARRRVADLLARALIVGIAGAAPFAIGSGCAGQAGAVLVADAVMHALVLVVVTVSVGAVAVVVAAADLVASNFDALLFRAVVARFADRLALAGRGIAILVARAVIVATADAAAALARESSAVLLAVALAHALALTQLAVVAAGAVAVAVAAADAVAVEFDTLLVGAVGA